jgi:hypothetical protein
MSSFENETNFFELVNKFFYSYQSCYRIKNKEEKIQKKVKLLYILYSSLNRNYFQYFHYQDDNLSRRKHRILLSELSDEFCVHLENWHQKYNLNTEIVVKEIKKYKELSEFHYQSIINVLENLFCNDILLLIVEYL